MYARVVTLSPAVAAQMPIVWIAWGTSQFGAVRMSIIIEATASHA